MTHWGAEVDLMGAAPGGEALGETLSSSCSGPMPCRPPAVPRACWARFFAEAARTAS